MTISRRLFLLPVLLAALTLETSAQVSSAGGGELPVPDPKWAPVTQDDKEDGRRVALAYKWQGVSHRYPAVIPPAYFRGEKPEAGFPLIVELGGGDGGYGHPVDAIRIGSAEHGPRHGYFVAAPIAVSPRGFVSTVERVVLSVIRDMSARFPLDARNVFLVGYSNGAIGTYKMLFLFPDRFAGAAAASGSVKARWAERIRQVPTIIFHHEKDAIISVEYNRKMVAEMRQLGAKDGVDFLYREEPGKGHVQMPYMNEEMILWFDHCRQRKQRDEAKDLNWALSQFPWLRREVPRKPKSDREQKVAETVIKVFYGADYSQAPALYKEAVECRLESGDPWYALGVMLYDLKQYEKSILAFKQAVTVFYENPRDYRVATAYLWIGRDLDLLGRREEAVLWYTKARDTGNPIDVAHAQYGIAGSARDLGERGIHEPFQRIERRR